MTSLSRIHIQTKCDSDGAHLRENDATSLSLFESLWGVEPAPPSLQPGRLFLDLAPLDETQRRRRLDRLAQSLADISKTWRRRGSDEMGRRRSSQDGRIANSNSNHSPSASPSSSSSSSTQPSASSSSLSFRFCLLSLLRLTLTSPFPDVASFADRQLKALVSSAPKEIRDNFSTTSLSLARIVDGYSSKTDKDSNKNDSNEETRQSDSLGHPSVFTISVFIADFELPALDGADETVAELFRRRFRNGAADGREAPTSCSRLDNLCRLLAAHPTYLRAFLRTEEELMGMENNPLVTSQARFLAIMSSAAQNCPYSVFLESQKFLASRGDHDWLKRGLILVGGEEADDSNRHKLAKFREISELSQLLLHRPWALEASHIAALVKPSSSSSSAPLWTVPELVHAIAVLAHFNGVACIVHGCGVAPEVDDELRLTRSSTYRDFADELDDEAESRCESLLSFNDVVDSVGDFIDRMKSIDVLTGPEVDAAEKAKIFQSIADEEPEIVVEGVEKCPEANVKAAVISSAVDVPLSPTASSSMDPSSCSQNLHILDVPLETWRSMSKTESRGEVRRRQRKRKREWEKFVGETSLKFIDFTSTRNRIKSASSQGTCATSKVGAEESSPQSQTPRKRKTSETSQKFEPLRLDEFSWQDHGYSIMSRFCEFSSLFDDKFEVAESLTYFTMGHRDEIDTTTFRVAVWNYVQLIYGIRHDDYDYRELSIMLDLPLRKFIKSVSCYPSRVTKELFDSCMTNFKSTEKIHVTIMIAEAKIQAQLLYALKAVNEYLK